VQVHEQRAERLNLERLVARVRNSDAVQQSEEAAIRALWRTAQHTPANRVLDPEGGIRLITKGWAAWLRYSDDGRRLIFLFLMPGDFIVPGLFQLRCCDLVSLTPLRTVDAEPLMRSGQESTPCSAAVISESGTYYRLLLLDHLTRLTIGCTTRSVAHLLVELHARSLKTGACTDGRFNFPIGQRVLARALGRSTVQVNKVIKQFQSDGLLSVGFDWIEMHDVEQLRKMGGMTHSVLRPARPAIRLEHKPEVYAFG
jgi:hypothetical protein